MLQQIQFHIHEDEQEQQRIEKELAFDIRENYRLSVGAFERYIPSLVEVINKPESSINTIFCNKSHELNIVNYNSGQVLYGEQPRKEVIAHLKSYLSRAPVIPLSKSKGPDSSVFVSLGLGLGYHLEHILDSGRYKHIVVYEPNVDYFICSLSAINWKDILQKAKETGVALYLQIGADATNFQRDIRELATHVAINKLVFYKHLNIPLFNSLEACLQSGSWEEVEKWRPRRRKVSLSESYLPVWAPLRQDYERIDLCLNEAKKEANLEVLKKYFPNLYDEFVDYTPKNWEPLVVSNGEVSVSHNQTDSLFSTFPQNDAATSYRAFTKKPNKDGLLLSYKGKKLKGYLHYQLVEACENVIKDVTEVQSELPEKVRSLIMFGVGSGYSLASLIENHDVEMLFICEPNKDFFYASLYAVDWHNIIKSFDEGKKRLYLNIGDDGSNLTNDLLVQFQSVGPYVLANTYFYQTYVNEKLTDSVAQLREQLLVMIAMGDYFDNAKYGIAHTRWALESDVPFLLSNSKDRLLPHIREIPVFIVGNGPSLDGLLDVLKEHGDKALIISCGTALQALHKNGIKPDFHTEIETNRSTFDWITRIDDEEYLKAITLLSCNGMHPDAATLFGRTLLAFKQGEASTVSISELNKDQPFTLLNFAYPTVTNFAADFFTAAGFNQIYLFGTDMGFVSDSYHHSKSSGYYDGGGKELYRYSDNHEMSLVIPGNFKPWVKTKYEFKISKTVLEQVFAQPGLDVYNLNDGAKIVGAQALDKELILLSSTSELKSIALQSFINDCFSSELNKSVLETFDTRYSTTSLIEELGVLSKLLESDLTSKSDVETLVGEQREFIVSSYLRKKSLGFYYLNGTLKYINSMFSKLLNIIDEDVMVTAANSLLDIWRQSVASVLLVIKNDQFGLDNISPHSGLRRHIVLRDICHDEPITVSHVGISRKLTSSLVELAGKGANSGSRKGVLNWLSESNRDVMVGQHVCNISRKFNRALFDFPTKGLSLISNGDYKNDAFPCQSNELSVMNTALMALLSGFENAIFLQKISEHPGLPNNYFEELIEWSKSFYCYSGPDYIVLTNEPLKQHSLLLPTSDRLVYIPSLNHRDLRIERLSQSEYEDRIETINSLFELNVS